MHKIPISILLLFTSLFSFPQFSAQQRKQMDSLNNVIENSEQDTSVAAAYVDISEILFIVNLDTVVHMSEKASELALLNLNHHNLDQAERRSFLITLGRAVNNLGYVRSEYGDLEGALDYYHDALYVQQLADYTEGIAWTYNNIGFLFFLQERWESCFENYHKALDLFDELGDDVGKAHMYNNLGLAYKTSGDTTHSMEYYEDSHVIREKMGDRRGVAQALHNIGHLLLAQGKLHDALSNFQQALAINEEIHNRGGISGNTRSIGRIYLMLGEVKTAHEYGSKAMEYARETGNPRHLEQAARLMIDIYEEEGNYKEVWEMAQFSKAMQDSVDNQEVERLNVEREMQHEFDTQRRIQKAEHQKELQLSAEREKRQELFSYGIAVILLLLAVFSYFIYNRLKLSKRQNLIIDSQKKLVETKNKEITDSINYAKRIQQAIVPSNELMQKILPKAFVLYIPKDIVAGDFYWMKEFDNRILVAAADCTGHGVPGAMVSVVCNNALNRSVREFGLRKPSDILDKTRELVIQEFDESSKRVNDGMDISLVSIEYTDTGAKVEYAGANNPLWVVNGESFLLDETKADKQPVGNYEGSRPFTNHSVDLKSGDTIYIFSDGFPDQFGGEKGKKYYSGRFKNFLMNLAKDPIEDQKVILETEFNMWRNGREQVDDVCVIGVRI